MQTDRSTMQEVLLHNACMHNDMSTSHVCNIFALFESKNRKEISRRVSKILRAVSNLLPLINRNS